MWHQNQGVKAALGRAWRKPTYWPCGARCIGGVTLIWALVGNLRTCAVMLREKAQAADPRGRKYRCADAGADCFVVALKRGNARGAKGAGHSRRGQQGHPDSRQELIGYGGRRQPSLSGTSRISREAYVRFCERCALKAHGVQSPEMAIPVKLSSQPGTESCVVIGNENHEA
jgi:hypothetical protein